MRVRLSSILGLATAFACGSAMAQDVHAGAFEGAWAVTVDCPASSDGDAAFFYAFKAQVAGDLIHGEHGMAGQPGSFRIDGVIQADGKANLQAAGITGSSRYGADPTKSAPYRHPVSAHFTPQHGAGSWTANRICNLTFDRP
jgi:hypothetical protein